MNNLSDIPYGIWVQCFAQADLDGVATLEVPPIMANSHYAISPHYSLLCNNTKDPSSWYCTQALAGLRNFVSHGGSASGYHAYEVMLSYQAVLDAGVKVPLNTTELAAFQASVYNAVMQYSGHETRVENHGLDAAIEQLYMLRIWPKLNETCSSCRLDVGVINKLERVPQQILANWLHGHALDEYAIGYDAISIVRLIAVLEMIDTTDDLHSEDWKQFVLRFADSITPAGCFSNHGGGLQDDGSPYTTSPYRLRTPTQAIPYGSCSGVFPFVFFFERTATLFQHRDPQAASYCKWAARALFRQINPYNDFANLYYIVKAMNEEQAQVKAGGPIPIPDLVDIRSKTIMKNEYQKDKHRVDGGPVPAQHVLCSSRAVGSPYVQSSVYTVPGGYHGSGEQAGTMSHYEYRENLFIFSGPQTKHTSQSDADTGLPILMPYSAAADGRFPWRWGQHNLAPGRWQRVDMTTILLAGSRNEMGNWDTYQPVFITSAGKYGSSGVGDVQHSANLGFTCRNAGSKPYYMLFGSIELVADNGTVFVVDDFSYHELAPQAWGPGSTWVFPNNGSNTVALRLDCPPNSTTTVMRPVSTKQQQQPCSTKPQPCPAHPGTTFCMSDKTPGQCTKKMPHKPCPPCPQGPPPPPPTRVPPLNITFQYDDLPYLRYHFMVDHSYMINTTYGYTPESGGYAASEYLDAGIPFGFIGAGGAPSSTFIARFENYTASNNARNDSGGGWAAAGYGGWTRETVWTRRMVLTQEGALVVLDSLQTSEQDGDWLGGPLWQMKLGSNLTTSESEGDWFDLSDFPITTQNIERLRGNLPARLNLVAKMGAVPGRTHGVAPGFAAPPTCNNVTQAGGCDWRAQSSGASGWQTLYSKQKIAQNSQALFVTVFVPYPAIAGRAVAESLARGVTITTSDDGATVVLTPYEASTALIVKLDVHGAWNVTH